MDGLWARLDDTLLSEIGVRVLALPSPDMPKRRTDELIIPGRDGSVLEWAGDYEPLTLSVLLAFELKHRSDLVKLLQKARRLETSLYSGEYYECELLHLAKPTRKYLTMYEAEAVFQALPFRRQVVPDVITATGTHNGRGDTYTKPLLLVEAAQGVVTVTTKSEGLTNTLTINNEGASRIAIDAEAGIVQKGSERLRFSGTLPHFANDRQTLLEVKGAVLVFCLPRWGWL